MSALRPRELLWDEVDPARHPFDDGNGRSAFLTLVFVLAREGGTLDDVSLLRRLTYRADSPRDALLLTRHVGAHLAGVRSPQRS